MSYSVAVWSLYIVLDRCDLFIKIEGQPIFKIFIQQVALLTYLSYSSMNNVAKSIVERLNLSQLSHIFSSSGIIFNFIPSHSLMRHCIGENITFTYFGLNLSEFFLV